MLDCLWHGETRKRRAKINLHALIIDQGMATNFLRHIAQHVFGELHEVMEIAIGNIKLHHRKFRIVANTHAFIAKIAVNLEHPFEAANDQAL